jgi:DNA-binding MarR family transcriptional regulator
MNEFSVRSDNADHEYPLTYQARRLQDLMSQVTGCCEDRKVYELQRFNLPYAEIRCLMLFKGERYLTVKGIAQRLDVAKSRVTRIVDGLLEKGLVERIDDPQDGRIKLVNLTSAGLKISEEIESFRRGIYDQILTHLDVRERRALLSNLESLRAAMEAVKADLA